MGHRDAVPKLAKCVASDPSINSTIVLSTAGLSAGGGIPLISSYSWIAMLEL